MKKGHQSRYAYPMLSRETYLELFGMTPEELFTAEELQRIEQVIQKDAELLGSKS